MQLQKGFQNIVGLDENAVKYSVVCSCGIHLEFPGSNPSNFAHSYTIFSGQVKYGDKIIATRMGSSIILISPEHGAQAQRKVKTLGVGGNVLLLSGPKNGGPMATPYSSHDFAGPSGIFKLKTKLTFKRTFCTANLLVFGPASTKDQRPKDQINLKFLFCSTKSTFYSTTDYGHIRTFRVFQFSNSENVEVPLSTTQTP